MTADHSADMHVSRAPKREVWLAGVVLGVIALLYRYAWIPNDPQAALQHVLDTFGLPVTGVGTWFTAWTLGDGQAFAIIATDPLGLDEGWQLGYPAYRYSRAGLGWLAWLASLGQPKWVPYGMAIVGVVTILGLFYLATRLRPQLGRSAWLIAFNPAVLIAFAGDTAEALGILALAWVLATGRWWASAALGVIRPSFLIALVGRWQLLGPGVLSALVLGGLWIMRFGFFPDQYGGSLGWPLVGYLEEPSMQSTLLAIAALATLFVGVRRRHWGWMASGLMVLCFTGVVIASANDGWRTAGMLFVLWAFGPEYSAPYHRRLRGQEEGRGRGFFFAARGVSWPNIDYERGCRGGTEEHQDGWRGLPGLHHRANIGVSLMGQLRGLLSVSDIRRREASHEVVTESCTDLIGDQSGLGIRAHGSRSTPTSSDSGGGVRPRSSGVVGMSITMT